MGGAASIEAFVFSAGDSRRKYSGTLALLQGSSELSYEILEKLPEVHPALLRRRAQLGMTERVLLCVSARCSLEISGLKDEPMVCVVDVFEGKFRVHMRSPTNEALGGVVLEVQDIGDAPTTAPVVLVGGDEYWSSGYPPIIRVQSVAANAAAAPARPPSPPTFYGSFFEKDVALRGLED
ncbi:hypothetical protein M885DRAFT_506203 [Pelagophyceae sp. CCMP2097]|nr:hypothetical protein M885DRAFT_506203 [Pelagophyceae sp. CCMP2097]